MDTITETRKTEQQLPAEVTRLRQRIIELEAVDEKRERVEALLRARALQQAVVAELGQRVLAGIDLTSLLDEATVLVADTLKAEFCQVLKLMPDRDVLLLRAGVGWTEGLVGVALVEAQPDTHMGYTLFSSEPVIVKDIYSDVRFRPSTLLQEHGIVSGMSVIIDDDKWPFGVLSVHTRERRVFTRDDINILQAVANVLATAVKHKRSQAALREAHLQLEARVRERTYDLQAANEELRAFAQTISRDLKLPLQNIRDYLNRLGLTVDDIQETLIADTTGPAGPRPEHMIRTLEHDIPETMGSLNQSVAQIERLVSAILRLSRLAHGELTYEPIDMAELVRTTLEMLALRLGHRGVAVSVGAVPSIVADRMAMEQILGHILANAVVYLDPDRPGRIRIEGETNHHEVIYRVQDNGRGIAPDVMRQIFELFCRGGEHDVPGEGTGLAYVKTLVRRHGGRIWCESEPGVGTKVFFTISNQLNQS